MLLTDVMPILRADVKELAGNRHADIEQLLQLLPEALSGARAGSTMRRYVPLWGYFKDWCTGHDLQFLPAAPLTVALYLLKLAQTANSFSTIKVASCHNTGEYMIRRTLKLKGMLSAVTIPGVEIVGIPEKP